MSDRGPLVDAIRRARGAVAWCNDGCAVYGEIRHDDLRLLVDAAVQSLADADDVRSTLAVRPVVDDDGTVVEVTALLPEAPR